MPSSFPLKKHSQSMHNFIKMASFCSVPRRTNSPIIDVGYMLFASIALFVMVYLTTTEYLAYRQSELEMKKFSLKTTCHIDRIISRPQEDKKSLLITINTSFLISFEISSNGNSTKQHFEEWSVPVPFKSGVVSIRI
jgi:hypothetical protein